jgi:predicted dehydrogenase
MTLELNGEDASLSFDLHDPQWLSFFEYRAPDGRKIDGHTTGWRRIHVTNFEHPYMDRWWVPGLSIGYEHTFIHAAADLLRGVETGTPAEPTFRTALATQRVSDAILQSAREGSWVETEV